MRVYVDDTPDSVVLLDGYDVDFDHLDDDDSDDVYSGLDASDYEIYDNFCD